MQTDNIRIQVRLFAALRERTGVSEQALSMPAGSRIAEVWPLLDTDEPLPANVLVARNMEYARLDTVVEDGDEVAFFPPVTGG